MVGKSYTELSDLEKEILVMAEGGDQGDPEYWEQVLSHLKVYKARAKLRDLQHTLMEKHMSKLTEIVKEQQEQAANKDDKEVLCALSVLLKCCLLMKLLKICIILLESSGQQLLPIEHMGSDNGVCWV